MTYGKSGRVEKEMPILAGDDLWEVGAGWEKRCPVGAGHDVFGVIL